MEQTFSHHNLNTDFTYSHNTMENPKEISTHLHDCYELFFLISSDVTYYIEGQTYKLNKNDLIITNARELHRIMFHSDKSYERKIIQFKAEYISSFQTKEYNMLYNFEKRKLGYFNKIDAQDVNAYGIDQHFNNIEKYWISDLPEKNVMLKTSFAQMLVDINNIFSKNKKNSSDYYTSDKKIESVLEYINLNIDKKITLDLLEQVFFVNKYHLCHIFKSNTGFSIMEYISYKRIVKAKELLDIGMPVIEVCHTVGFGDYSNFYKVFKRLVGVSPKKIF